MSEIRKGMLLVISGPSGTGKGTIIEHLMAADGKLVFSVSATTRAPREGEVDGKHYHFMTVDRYNELVAQDAFVEHAQVHGNFYGTLKSEVNERLARGEDVVLDIDVQGALNVIRSGIQCVSIFAHGGKPMPCVQPLRIQNAANISVTVEQPKRRFINAESTRPTDMKMRPLRRSAQKPFTKRLTP